MFHGTTPVACITWLLAAGPGWIIAAPPDTSAASQPAILTCPTADGYHGIWYANQPTHDEYRYKYSGGLGTYCAKHIPMAYYARQINKTFFVYGGTPPESPTDPSRRTLLIMISYYDHATGRVPRPRILMDKKTSDAHDNPVLMLDEQGYIWAFASAHGTARPAYIYKSVEPYDIDRFQLVLKTNFSYPQPWYVPGKGFLFLHTRYEDGGRSLYVMTSPDGFTWSSPRKLARIEKGHYQISWQHGDKIGTAFNYHPADGGLNHRTNLYYMETKDFGQTWTNAKGEKLTLPLTDVHNPALVRDYAAQGKLVYLKDLNFDQRGLPIILFLTSRGWQPGPANGPRKYATARCFGHGWEITSLLLADNNYDTGCLHIEPDRLWRLIAPTLVGRSTLQTPQPYNPGGEMMMWTSDNAGRTWRPQALTDNSPYNHNYARRPVHADPGFYAFWADGHGREPSESRLYFTTRDGQVFRLPQHMDGDFATPEPLTPGKNGTP